VNDFYSVRIDEASRTLDDRDAEPIEQPAGLSGLNRSHLAFVLEKIIDGCFPSEREIDSIEGPRFDSRESQGCFAESLARYGARVDRGTSHCRAFLDDGHLFPEQGSGVGGSAASRSSADDHEIVLLFVRHS
jgi:hypothetical protein